MFTLWVIQIKIKIWEEEKLLFYDCKFAYSLTVKYIKLNINI